MAKMKQKVPTLFDQCADGFGFDEIEQSPDGIYCTGCLTVHKRPTKMYSNGYKGYQGETLCRFQVIRLYNPNDEV